MKSILFKAVIIPSLIITACKPVPKRKTEIQYKIVADKKIISNSKTYFLIAFTDGDSESTNFGFYSCLEVGDSVKFYKDSWQKAWKMDPKCKQNNN